MIIWLNGTFGAGKTTTARELVATVPGARLFDPEMVGYLLRAILPDHTAADFQDLPPWRALVPATMSEIAGFTGQHLITAQTVLNEGYWTELRKGLEQQSLEVFHVLLHVGPESLTQRINADSEEPGARPWRLSHIASYLAARDWMTAAADLVIDSTVRPVPEVARLIRGTVWPGG
jgi:shikimate kinase